MKAISISLKFFAHHLKRQILHAMSFNKDGSFLQNDDISRGNVCGICIDGAPAVLGCRPGFQRLAINALEKAVGTHCITPRQVLATRTLPQEFQDIVKSVVNVMNFVKASA